MFLSTNSLSIVYTFSWEYICFGQISRVYVACTNIGCIILKQPKIYFSRNLGKYNSSTDFNALLFRFLKQDGVDNMSRQ